MAPRVLEPNVFFVFVYFLFFFVFFFSERISQSSQWQMLSTVWNTQKLTRLNLKKVHSLNCNNHTSNKQRRLVPAPRQIDICLLEWIPTTVLRPGTHKSRVSVRRKHYVCGLLDEQVCVPQILIFQRKTENKLALRYLCCIIQSSVECMTSSSVFFMECLVSSSVYFGSSE